LKITSDLKLVIISFLKENGISYYCDNQNIIVPCFNCGTEININSATSIWKCNYCNQSGNLKTLIDHKQEYAAKPSLYNPRNEKNEILRSLRAVINIEPDESIKKKLESIYEKTHELTNYLLEKKEPEY
jgi:ribosomal protein L37AE/L43A